MSFNIDHKGNEFIFQLAVMSKYKNTYKYGKSESKHYIVRCLEIWLLSGYIIFSLIIKKTGAKR